MQYHTELSGRITTFNFADDSFRHLSNQQYSICLRHIAGRPFYFKGSLKMLNYLCKEGHCCVVYEACQDVDNAFSISDLSMSATDDDCLGDYVLIEGGYFLRH